MDIFEIEVTRETGAALIGEPMTLLDVSSSALFFGC